MYKEALINKGYTYVAAQKQFEPILGSQKSIKNLFYFAQMTNLRDYQKQQKYTTLKFVEWLEFICRVALIDELPSQSDIQGAHDMAEPAAKTEQQIEKDKLNALLKIHELLEKLWAQRQKVYPPDAPDKKIVINGKIKKAQKPYQLSELEAPGDNSSDGYDSCDH